MSSFVSKPAASWYSISTQNVALVTPFSSLSDGACDSVTRFQFTNTDVPGSPIQIKLESQTTAPAQGFSLLPVIVGILGGTLPAGLPIKIYFRRVGQTAYNYQPYAMPNVVIADRLYGGTGGFAVNDQGGVLVTGIMLQIDNPSQYFALGQYFDIAEVLMADATPVTFDTNWLTDVDDNTNRRYSHYRQPQPYPGYPRTVATFTPIATTAAQAYATRSAFASLTQGRPAVICLRTLDETNTYSSDTVNAHTYFGDITKIPTLTHVSGPTFTFSQGQFTETPIIPSDYLYDDTALLYNVALASSGATAMGIKSDGTTPSTNLSTHPASSAIDGSVALPRVGIGSWGNAGGWSSDGTVGNQLPNYFRVSFAAATTINRVVLYTLPDGSVYPNGAVVPTDTMKFTLWGITAFDVQTLDDNGTTWTTRASITGNNLIKRSVTFAAVKTSAIRIRCVNSLENGVAANTYARIVELEVYSAPG